MEDNVVVPRRALVEQMTALAVGQHAEGYAKGVEDTFHVLHACIQDAATTNPEMRITFDEFVTFIATLKAEVTKT